MAGSGAGSESGWRASQQKIALANGNCYNDFYFLLLDLVVGYGWLVAVLVLQFLEEVHCELWNCCWI